MEQTEQHKSCIECGEPIRLEARRCPHCHSAQNKDRVGLIGTVVKWCSGVAVVVSVIMALGNLTRVVDSWLKDDIYASQLAESARMAMQQGDNDIAEELLKEAAKLKPSSDEVRSSQVKLAMLTVQKRFVMLSNDDFGPINDAYTVLYKNIGFDDSMRYDVLAHIGWAAALMGKNNSEYYFDQVLGSASDHFYALVFKAYWMLSDMVSDELKDTLSRDERYLQATELFDKARTVEGSDRLVVLKWRLEALRRYSDMAAGDYIKLAINERPDIELLGVNMVKSVRRELSSLADDAIYRDAIGDEARFESLIGSLSEKEVEQMSGFIVTGDELHHHILARAVRARYLQSKGEFAAAFEGFTTTHQKYGDNSIYRAVKALPKLIDRLCKNTAWEESVTRCSPLSEQSQID